MWRMGEGDREVGRGKMEQGGEHAGLIKLSWVKQSGEEQRKRYLEKGSHCGVNEKSVTRETPRKQQI